MSYITKKYKKKSRSFKYLRDYIYSKTFLLFLASMNLGWGRTSEETKLMLSH